MNKIKAILLAGLLSISSIGHVAAQGGDVFAAENFSSTLTFTTDYTFRGTSFSGLDPAIQGSFDWSYGPWFAGAWGTSSAPNEGTTFEIDYYAGWSDTVGGDGGLDVTIFPLLYTFPGQGSVRDDTTFELWTSFGRGFEGIPGSPYLNLDVNWSPEYFDGGDSSFYFKPSIAFSLPNGFGIDFAYGYQDVGGRTIARVDAVTTATALIPGIGGVADTPAVGTTAGVVTIGGVVIPGATITEATITGGTTTAAGVTSGGVITGLVTTPAGVATGVEIPGVATITDGVITGGVTTPAIAADFHNGFFGDDYSHFEIGITKSLLGFDLDLRYHDNQDEDTAPGFALESEYVFTVSRSF